MPELPEVETVARQLAKAVRRRTVSGVKVHDTKLKSSQLERISQHSVKSVSRSGKQVLFTFSRAKQPDLYLAVHLRMTGRLVWCAGNKSIPENELKHIRACMELNGGKLFFVDPRRFGTMALSKNSSDFSPKGLEPMSPDFTLERLTNLLRNAKQNMKAWLLRQDKIVGIGNIYASEILHDCKISPKRSAHKLRKAEIALLHKSIQKILARAIENCGTTFSDFQDAHGVTGSYQHYLKVYERENLPCKRCKTSILRITQQQRSTYYCRNCQS